MPDLGKVTLIAAAAIAGFSLLLLIISVATPVWLDDGNGDTVGLFRQCYANNIYTTAAGQSPGCANSNQVTQGGLSIFGLLLLLFSIVAIIAGIFVDKPIIIYIGLGLLYFASMFIMAAYATWGVYSRDPNLYAFPTLPIVVTSTVHYTSMGYSYNLCVACHYFLWTALTILAFGVGYNFNRERNETN